MWLYPYKKLFTECIGQIQLMFLFYSLWLALVVDFLRRFSHHSDPVSGVARLINNKSHSTSTLASLQSLQPFPDDFTRGITPIPCHSHNDYWRYAPLLDAISAGCTSVEADIWVSAGKSRAANTSELYVGHSRGSSRPERTLRSMYVEPLVYILDQINNLGNVSAALNSSRLAVNGIFESNPNTTLVLLIDFKQSPVATNIWNLLEEQLQPLRERQYLTYWNSTKNERVLGPVTIVSLPQK